MVQFSYPGVYVVEKSSGVKTITGVATSIGAFFGRTLKGPMNSAVRCFSYADFLRVFGGAHSDSELAASLKLFFDNGGTDTYVVRLAGAGAQKAGIDLRNPAGTAVLSASAKVEGEWGNGLRLEVSYGTANPGESFTLTVIQEEGGKEIAREVHTNLVMDPAAPRYAPTFVSQSSALITLSKPAALDLNIGSFEGFSEARRPLGTNLAEVQASLGGLIAHGTAAGARRFDISVNGSAYVTVDLTEWDVNDAGVAAISDLETQLRDRVNAALASLVPAPTVVVTITDTAETGGQMFLRITADSGDEASVRVRRASASDIAGGLMMGVDNGGIEMARRSNFRPAQTGSVFRASDNSGGLANLNTLAFTAQNGLTAITVAAEAAIQLDADPNDIRTTGAADPFYQSDASMSPAHGGNDGVREKLQIIAQALTNAPGSQYRAEVQGHDLVVLAKSGTFNQIPGSLAFGGAGAGAVNATLQSNTRQVTLGPNGTSAFAAFNAATQTGDDGGAPDFAAYVGDANAKTGFHALDPVDLFNLMVLPADSALTDAERRALWGPASIYAQSRRAFLLIDAPDSWTDAEGRPAVVQGTDDVNNMRATVVKDHSAVFYPKLIINDGGTARTVGSAGAMAGLAARTDATRGVWKAFAGTDASLNGVSGLATRMTDPENGVLNKLGVNCARQFPSGYVNWGARTMDGSDDLSSEHKYIPIRRLTNNMAESLYRGTQWVTFEPNDEPLWAKIRLNVGVYLNGLFRQGAFQGSTPSEAYFVKCDGETTTQADRNAGVVNIEVGFAPLKPAEFVHISIQQIVGDLA